MNKAREHCGIFPQEGMPGGFPLTDLYKLLSITGTTCSSNRLSCFPSLTQGDRGMCQQKGKSDISGALSSLPHLKSIYYCNQLHFLITFSFKVIWENLLKSKFWKAPLWMIPSHPKPSGNVKLCWWASVVDELQVEDHWSRGLGTGLGLNLTGPSEWPHYNLLDSTWFLLCKTTMIFPPVTWVSWG